MTRGKIIVVEGTDCSGKETQSKILIDNLKKEGIETVYYGFPAYDTPTGRIVGLSYLGKPYLAEELVKENATDIISNIKEKYEGIIDDKLLNIIIDAVSESLGKGWFKEGAPQVDPKISSLYYAADRAYNAPVINNYLNEGKNVILDRYIYSNLAHQGGKIEDSELRKAMYDWNCNLEFNMMGLPASDVRLFLHMPTEYASILRAGRAEKLDENERDVNHLLHAEKAYLEVAKMFDFETIECVKAQSNNVCFEDIKTPEEISHEVYDVVKRKLTLR